MERYVRDYGKNHSSFFILGASDNLAQDMKKLAIKISMRLNSSIEYLMKMPIDSLLELAESICEVDQERQKD